MTRLRTPAQRLLLVAAMAASTAFAIGACGSGTAPRPNRDAGGQPTTGASATAGTSTSASASASAGSGAESGAAGSPLPEGWRLCTNAHRRYDIGYPAGWYTTSLRPEEVCGQFSPRQFTIPDGGEYPLTPLNAVQTPDAFPVDVTTPADTVFTRTLLWQQTTVGDRRAVRFEEEFTGAGLHERGTRRYGYMIDRDGRSFLVCAMVPPGANDYAASKAVVDQAVWTLRLR